MSESVRPYLRELFVSAERRLEVSFYTSNLHKFLQARMVLEPFGIILKHSQSHQDPYAEDYRFGKQQLLTRAIEQVRQHVGRGSLFFVEDTSVAIHPLATEEGDYPGLAVKEWFAKTRFEDLDTQLRQRGKDRSATIASDIALHIPGLSRPVYFRGEVHGRVADTPPAFEASVQHPWLTPESFNGWFVPDGTTKRLGEMSFEESLTYDFRVRALWRLVESLEQYAAVLNLPASAYSRRRRIASSYPQLFPPAVPVIVVVGKMCAGKTTFGQHASMHHQIRFIEASGVVRMLGTEFEVNANDSFELARRVLERGGPDVIARKIQQLLSDDLWSGAVISGFRTVEELEFVRRENPHVRVVLITASERTRFERHLRRGRTGSVKSLDDFKAVDEQQCSFGLLRVVDELVDVRIDNEGSMSQFQQQISVLLGGSSRTGLHGVSASSRTTARAATEGRLYRALSALERIGGVARSDEIATASVEVGKALSARHANWILSRHPEFASRFEGVGDRIRYQLRPAGQAYLRVIRELLNRE